MAKEDMWQGLKQLGGILGGNLKARVLSRIGETESKRLEWALSIACRDLESLTPGDWHNLQWETYAFINLGLRGQQTGITTRRPSNQDIREIKDRFRELIEGAIHRTQLPEKQKERERTLYWDKQRQRYEEVIRYRQFNWPDFAGNKLLDLIQRHGNLLKECPAPAVRSKAPCGTWFVASRPNQDYCSAACQSRTNTRRARRTR